MYKSSLAGMAAPEHAPDAVHPVSAPLWPRERLVSTGPTVQALLVDKIEAIQLQLQHERLRLEICGLAQSILAVATKADECPARAERWLGMRTSIDTCIAGLIRCRDALPEETTPREDQTALASRDR